MRGDYSMTLLEFVLTGLTLAAALIVFVALPDWLVGWVFAGLALIVFVVMASVILRRAMIGMRTSAPPEDWRERHRRWEEENKRTHPTDGS